MNKNLLIVLSILLSIKYIFNISNEKNSTLTILDSTSNKELKNNLTTDISKNQNASETNQENKSQQNSSDVLINNNINLNNVKDEIKENSDELINEEDFKIIVIKNYKIDELVRKWFYFLTFILVIFIVGFLYKFYKCYFINMKKEMDDDGIIMRNPKFDTELQRIATSDEDNILDLSNS